jgi:hypothetical protein
MSVANMTKLYPYLFLCVTCCFQACNLVNPKETIPTFLELDYATVQALDTTKHGSVSHKITDVWVYYNLELLGAFELPARVPIMAEKSGQVQIIAGIWENGLSAIRARYPFYTVNTLDLEAAPTTTITHNPVFKYRIGDSSNTWYFIEDFEQGNSFGAANGDTTFIKTNTPEDVFEGNWSSKMVLNDSNRKGEGITVQEFVLPGNKNCYLELNYKSDIPFVLKTEITRSGSSFRVDLIGINPSATWNKIYFNLGPYVAQHSNAIFKFLLTATLPENKTSGQVQIDNFKVIRFQ